MRNRGIGHSKLSSAGQNIEAGIKIKKMQPVSALNSIIVFSISRDLGFFFKQRPSFFFSLSASLELPLSRCHSGGLLNDSHESFE